MMPSMAAVYGEMDPLGTHLGSRRNKWQVSCEDDLSFDEVAGFDHLLLHVEINNLKSLFTQQKDVHPIF